MRKVTTFTLYLAVWIIGIFGIAMMMTFVNDSIQMSGFFQDTKRSSPDWSVDPYWNWGIRHYWYFWMCTLLWLLSCVRCIVWAVWFWDKK